MIFRRSPGVPVLDNYADYRPQLRVDFQHRCAYCLTHEKYFLDGDAGEIDHHRPRHPPPKLGEDFSALEHDYNNLYWTCRKCNRSKGNRWPTRRQYGQGQHFLDPCSEDHDDHWDTHTNGTVTPKTPTGRYTIRHILLNRPTLVKRGAEMHRLQETVTLIEAELHRVELNDELRAVYHAHLADVRKWISPPIVGD